MRNLFIDTSLALAPDGVLPITDFGIRIISRFEAEIYCTVGGKDISSIVDIDVDYSPEETGTSEYPGGPASAEIINIFGLNIAERHSYDEYMTLHNTEDELLKVIERDRNE